MKVKLIITESGKGKTLNPLGDKPNIYACDTYRAGACNYRFVCCEDAWQQAESERKTFRIEPQLCKCPLEYGKCPTPTHCFWEPNTIHTAQLIEGDKIRIL